jgi:hypothetical protein
MSCVKCGADGGIGDMFCVSCGEPLFRPSQSENRFCTHCGAKLDPGVKFCTECGKAVESHEPPSASTRSPLPSTVKPAATPELEKPLVANVMRRSSPAPIASSPEMVPTQPAAPPAQQVSSSAVSTSPVASQTYGDLPATTPQLVDSASSGPVTPISGGQPSKGGSGRGFVIGALAAVVIGGAAYWFVGKSKSPEASSPPSAKAQANAPAAESQSPANLATESGSSGPTQSVNVSDVLKSILAMVDAVKAKDESSLQKALEAIKQMPVTRRGDRATARAANTAGLARLQANELPEAIASFREGAAADPSDEEILNNLGYALSLAGKEDEAIDAFARTIALSPERSSAWANLSVSYAKKDQMDQGVAAYLLAYRFSKNQEKTRAFLLKQSEEAQDPKERELSVRVLKALDQQ